MMRQLLTGLTPSGQDFSSFLVDCDWIDLCYEFVPREEELLYRISLRKEADGLVKEIGFPIFFGRVFKFTSPSCNG